MHVTAVTRRTRHRTIVAALASILGSISLLIGLYGNSTAAKTASAVTGLASFALATALYPLDAPIDDHAGDSVELGLTALQTAPADATSSQPDEVAVESSTTSAMETSTPALVTVHAGLRKTLTRPQLRRLPSHIAAKVSSGIRIVAEPDSSTIAGGTCNGDTEATDHSLICLLVGSNPISLKILEGLLTRMGCTCILAHNGAEAMDAVFGQSRFDFIITDLSMPKVGGETLAQCIKSVPGKNQPTPVVTVSAHKMDHLPDGTFDALLSKPARQSDLIRVLRTLRCQVPIRCPTKLTRRISH